MTFMVKMLNHSIILVSLLLFLLVPPALCGSERPAMRVTTGVVQIHGWQNDLVQRQRNLSRWHWNPIYSYKQGLVGSGRNKGEPTKSHYSHQNKAVTASKDSHYLKPEHVPFSAKAEAEIAARTSLSGQSSAQAISGQIKPKAQLPGSNLAAGGMEPRRNPASYGGLDIYPTLAHAAVHGRLKSVRKHGLRATPASLAKGNGH